MHVFSHSSVAHARAGTAALTAALLVAGSGCNRRVFEYIPPTCNKEVAGDLTPATQKAADILIVVDNSGSMREEQQELARNFVNPNIAGDPNNPDVTNPDRDARECPIGNGALLDRYKNPDPSLYQAGGPLSECGFIQLLSAFENDFHVGVITTDTGLCDNRFEQNGEWGFRPQRGCLQPDGDGRDGNNLLITRDDLDDPTKNDLAGRFSATLDNIQTFGSGFERGLDAMQIFLSPGADRNPDCAGDLDLFRRPGAQLVVIVLSDEEDCSHRAGDAFPNENDGIVCGKNDFISERDNATQCYAREDDLATVPQYATFLQSLDAFAKVAVIAGVVKDAEDHAVASGCITAGNGLPSDQCRSAQGQSINPSECPADADPPCCRADGGGRYVEFADAFADNALVDSICNRSYRDTMLQIAAFIAANNFVDLADPVDPDVIFVEKKVEGSDPERLLAISPSDCNSGSGWYVTNDNKRIVLCGTARPGPGQTVSVRAKSADANPACVAAEGEGEGE